MVNSSELRLVGSPIKLAGWEQLVADYPWYQGEGQFQIPAYSEFMPPPRLGRSLYGEIDHTLFSTDDPYGWHITEIEEEYELKPGLEQIARQVLEQLLKLGQGLPAHYIAGHKGQNLLNNPYWPPELATRAGHLDQEQYVVFLPLALSRTQDDKGRVRWTLFGGSEQGPARAFWKGFFSEPGQELPEKQALPFFFQLLNKVYGESVDGSEKLLAIGFRILPTDANEDLPSWTRSYQVNDQASIDGIKYLLTFRPFSQLPVIFKDQYLSGKLVLLPFPGSLVFWGVPPYRHLQEVLPLAMQIPLLHLVARHSGTGSIRVPQSGWLHEPHPDLLSSEIQQELLRHNYSRTHRWERVHRYEDELLLNPRIEKVTKVLFSTSLDVMGLYDKPLARNCQLWTREFDLLLDGPNSSPEELQKAEAALIQGGLFGYRFLFPAMRVGLYDVYWQRPLVAYASPQTGEVHMLPDAPLGYLTAYREDSIDLTHPVELYPRLLRREPYLSALYQFSSNHDHYARQTPINILTLLDNWQLDGARPLPRSFARHLLRLSKHESLEQWLASLAERTTDVEAAHHMRESLENLLEPADKIPELPPDLTYSNTATRSFECAYWNDIQILAHGQYINKDNADCVKDPVTLKSLPHHNRDLEALGDYLISRHRQSIAEAGMEGKALCGELPFFWKTDFDFSLFGGWKINQDKSGYERNILVVIPGKNRNEAVVLGDHYDTAYMEDLYERSRGGSGARVSAAGADDNHSATAVLLRAAPIFLRLAQEDKLERDIWLLHLTGEEFPSDCMGARHFCQSLIERSLKLRLEEEQSIDLSNVTPVGVFVMDMIAHNNDKDPDIFQISPGKSPRSIYIAWQAHLANMIWNSKTKDWNTSLERHGRERGQRSKDGQTIPDIAAVPLLLGEVRTVDNPHSSLYNTDCQIFSDTGVPVVLFMENYDINRSGYHDTKDTMENIDLDYGAAVAAIAIETVARVATTSKLELI